MLRRTRRAPTACSWCHHRKVRCDASILGCPCTRCRQDGRTDCVLRAKLPKSRYTAIAGPGPDFFSVEPQNSQYMNFGEPVNNLSEQSLHAPEFEESANFGIEQSIFEQYQFLQKDLFSLSSEDKAFLYSKGSFALPPRELAKEFVEQFFLRIHPVAPVIDEAHFWEAWDGQSQESFSLFLFQAILFASCPFVPLDVLHQCGYVNKRDARKHLYNRAKLLFDLNIEKRPSAKAQGAILLTHHTSAEAPQAASLWLTRAIENAMMIDSQPSCLIENFSQHMKRRVWWSILLRDRSLCIGLRRRPQITSINLYGSRDRLSEDDFKYEMHNSRVCDYETKKHLLLALQEQCDLAVLLTDLVTLVFTPGIAARKNTSLTEFCSRMSKIEDIKQVLIKWEAGVQPAPKQNGRTKSEDPAATLRSLTFMYYHAARVDLAHYAAIFVEENMSLSAELYKDHITQIATDLSISISGLTSVMEYFSLNGNVEQLPLSVLAYAAMPLVLAAIDLKLSPSNFETDKRQKRLDALSRIIRHSESLYDVTDFVAVGTNQILQLAYSITRNIFLPNASASAPRTSTSRLRISSAKDSDHQMLDLRDHARPNYIARPKSWFDAFISYPRAYLLISSSVDYSLAVGRLPCNDSLPPLVRQLPSNKGIARLPWTLGSFGDGEIPGSGMRKKRNSVSARSESGESSRTVATIHSTPEDNQHRHRRESTDMQVEEFHQSQFTTERPELQNIEESSAKDQRAPSDPHIRVNLDFLDFDAELGPCPPQQIPMNDCPGLMEMNFMNGDYNDLQNIALLGPQDDTSIAVQGVTDGFDTDFFQSLLHGSSPLMPG